MSAPMTPERRAEIRRAWDGVDAECHRLTITNTSTPGQLLHALSRASRDVPALLAEVERLRAKADKDHDELRDRRTDDLDVRGILKPAPGVGDPAVPMPLGRAVAPAIEWLVNDRDRLRAELAKRCDLDGCEEFREWLSGEKADADKRARQAEVERDEAREQVRVLAGLLKRGNPKVFCAQHPNHAEPGCEVCRDAEIFRAALDGTEGGQ